MARKKKEDSGPPGTPGWMVTYGDMMSLLLTFFIMLVAMSTIEKVKFNQAAGSLQGALGIVPSNTIALASKKIDADKPINRRSSRQEKKMRRKVQKMQQMIDAQNLKKDLDISMSKEGVGIRISDPNFFDLGKATLKPQSFAVLDLIIDIIKTVDYSVRIEGHTDDLPIRNPEFASNWELSAARALAILKYFQNRGKIDPVRLEAVGLGEHHPLVPNEDDESRSKNRRVEIFVLSKEFQKRTLPAAP
ncbi:MAG: flagellar motor protein MotB [Candidatus Delongbacteria bacterium]|nr:flagellar motor protein MotB [Candidatus Delongbacteria bacterium]